MTNLVTRRRFLAGAVGFPIVLAGMARSLAANAAGTVHEVVIEGLKFRPAMLAVKPGDRVRWTNRDLSPHTATAIEGGWDTGELKEGESAEITIRDATEAHYFCAYHPMMRGELSIE